MGKRALERMKGKRVSLLRVLELLTTYLTGNICKEVFQKVREAERERQWTLEALIRFWTEVIIRAPASLSQALEEIAGKVWNFSVSVEATPQAFFEKCQGMRPDFFSGVLKRFTGSMADVGPSNYAPETAGLLKRFGAVLILDGSKLEAIRHRLKILWDQRAVILPGCVTALYHVHQGLLRSMEFCADAAKAEIRRAESLLIEAIANGMVEAGNLIVGDRYYCTAQFFEFLSLRKLYGLFRRKRNLKLRKIERLKKGRWGSVRYEEWLVMTGASPKTPVLTLRWIRIHLSKSFTLDLLTNVLDRQQLTAEEACQLYGQRWTVERMFYDLKVVLNLNRIYAANPNAVAMQVYASAIVYCALRVAQSELASELGISPEKISTHKFFTRFTAAVGHYWTSEWTFIKVRQRNRRVRILKPTWEDMPYATVQLGQILCDERTGKRRKRRFCRARRRWKSLAHVGAI